MQVIPVPSTDDVEVVAYDHGGDGPPLVFCHATGLHARYWDPFAERLTDRHRCVAIDLRGHGDSTIPDGLDLAWQGMADDFLAVVDALELGPGVAAVGHSMGGATVMLAELTRPGAVRAAWLFEPILVPADASAFFLDDNPMAAAARRRREVFASRQEAFDRYAAKPPFDRCDPASLRLYVDHGFRDLPDGTVILKCRGEIEAQVFEHSRTGVFDRLPEIATAVVIAAGADDGPPARLAAPAAEALPHGRYERWPDLTHFGPLEDPSRLAEAVARAVA